MQKLHALYLAVHNADSEKGEAMARRRVFVVGGKGVLIAVAVLLRIPYCEAEMGIIYIIPLQSLYQIHGTS